MNTQQAAHYKMLAEAHANTPGDLAAAYRVIGELLDENEAMQKAIDAWDTIDDNMMSWQVGEICRTLESFTTRARDAS